jgi:hypothetical protein
VLTLTDAYMFGDDITADTFVSFSFASDALTQTFLANSNPTLGGGLKADGSLNSTGDLLIQPAFSKFEANSDGFNADSLGETGPIFVAGSSFQFSLAPVPEPSTWAMMTLGFVGLAFAGYRAQQASATAAA